MVLPHAEDVQTRLVGDLGEFDEIAQPHGGTHGVARRRSRQLSEGEESDLHASAHETTRTFSSQTLRAVSTSGAMACPPVARYVSRLAPDSSVRYSHVCAMRARGLTWSSTPWACR